MNCGECGVKFDGFGSKMHRNGYCQLCYDKLRYHGKFTKVKPKNCGDCNCLLDEGNVSGHISRCKKCYAIWLKQKKLNAELCPGCKKPNYTKGQYCKLCRKAASGKFIMNIPPTKVSQGKVTIPEDLKIDVMKLLVRYKNNLFLPVDYYITAHLYLTIFVWDVELDSYPTESQVAYMIGVLKNLILQC